MSTYRLHYSPGACSFAVHALLEEIGAPFERCAFASERLDRVGSVRRATA